MGLCPLERTLRNHPELSNFFFRWICDGSNQTTLAIDLRVTFFDQRSVVLAMDARVWAIAICWVAALGADLSTWVGTDFDSDCVGADSVVV